MADVGWIGTTLAFVVLLVFFAPENAGDAVHRFLDAVENGMPEPPKEGE